LNLPKLAKKASGSRFYRWLLSFGLNRMVPFNSPHKFKVEEISDHHLQVLLPYIKKNLNHLKGLHACAMATLAEVSSGFLLISKLDPRQYRLILKKLEMEYHYQAKMAARVRFEITEEWMENHIKGPLKENGVVLLPCTMEIYDVESNHLATGVAHWQIKDWKSVRTK
jgi:acyl-coenzyme A thioesterase PaaI-like protein